MQEKQHKSFEYKKEGYEIKIFRQSNSVRAEVFNKDTLFLSCNFKIDSQANAVELSHFLDLMPLILPRSRHLSMKRLNSCIIINKT